MKIPVIDLFAGPGGLGEGFCAFKTSALRNPFKIALSIEKDPFAHKTLELRSFFRQFSTGKAPRDYYEYLAGNITRNDLFSKHPRQAEAASEEAWHAELGKVSHQDVAGRIRQSLFRSKRWVLIGGPPCQAYSVVGRACMKGRNPKSFEKDHRHFLYKEYLKIIREHKPAVFVMENVRGLTSSKINGKYIFDKILKDLQKPGRPGSHLSKTKAACSSSEYTVYSLIKNIHDRDFNPKADYIIKCEKHGIPQTRHRVILLGVRSDLKAVPRFITSHPAKVPMWDAIKDLPKLRSGISDRYNSFDNWAGAIAGIRQYDWFMQRSLGRSFTKHINKYLLSLKPLPYPDKEFTTHQSIPKYQEKWFFDRNLNGVCNHVPRNHIGRDLHRYFFATCFAIQHDRTPQIKDFPKEIWPNHKNVQKAFEGKIFSDRFRVQMKKHPATTVISHISKDGHYFIHPDPTQCRSLTVREAARLQTFPDNYFFEGPRTSQYEQVGNAVPPLLARQIAEIVYDVIRQLG